MEILWNTIKWTRKYFGNISFKELFPWIFNLMKNKKAGEGSFLQLLQLPFRCNLDCSLYLVIFVLMALFFILMCIKGIGRWAYYLDVVKRIKWKIDAHLLLLPFSSLLTNMLTELFIENNAEINSPYFLFPSLTLFL